MTKDEALKLALEALLKKMSCDDDCQCSGQQAITAIKEALAQPKYRRGDRLICLETEEYCVIHISGTDRQWVKFPTSYIGVYTNEQVAELFELLPKEPEQEPVAWMNDMGTHIDLNVSNRGTPLYTTLPQRTWVGLTDDELSEVYNQADWDTVNGWEYERAIEAKLKEKNT